MDRHSELVMDLFDWFRETLGQDDFGAVLIKREETQVELYRDRIDRSLSTEEQVQALAEIRDQELLEAVLLRARRISSKY